jgi:hypothetical protein
LWTEKVPNVICLISANKIMTTLFLRRLEYRMNNADHEAMLERVGAAMRAKKERGEKTSEQFSDEYYKMVRAEMPLQRLLKRLKMSLKLCQNRRPRRRRRKSRATSFS